MRVVTGVPTLNRTLQGSRLGQKSEDEIRFNYLVIAQFEWAHEHPEDALKEIEKVQGTEEAETFVNGA